jgi:ribosomal protein S18 acetylase RimI-like enzyme
MKIVIRQYKDSDHDKVKEMVEKLMDYVVWKDPIKRIRRLALYGEVFTQKLLEKMKKQNGMIFIAEVESNIIGFASCYPSDSQSKENLLEVIPTQVGNLSDLYVEKEYRGKGVGHKLLANVEVYLKQKGCDSLWVEVFAPNEHAHRYYKKTGFIDREIGMLKKLK